MSSPAEIITELDRAPTLSAYSAAARKLKIVAQELPLFRAAILSNHTFDIGTTLLVECARRGLRLELHSAGYDQYRQELLDPHGNLAAFQPDAILISLHLESTFPGLISLCAERKLPAPAEWAAGLQALLEAYRQRSATPVFIQTFIPPAIEMDGLLSASGLSVFSWVMELNQALRQVTDSVSSAYMIDAAQLACRSDLENWHDRRLWFLARIGINPKKFPTLAAYMARHLVALRRPAAKCLVLDLDNTLWGGLLGESGPEGVLCAGGDYPGNAYAAFQSALLALRSRGVLLAVASKNDRRLVDEFFEQRADTLLRPEHISEWEVHWEPKPESLKRIAARLNIGLDSLVFLDDNPAEVDLVRMALPAVRAYQMPAKPEDFVRFLSCLEDFDQLQLSAEDARRAELYELRRKQAAIAETATDLESFYRSLKTVVTPEEANPSNLDRIVQLFQKTNQFNLTTRRRQKPELLERMANGSELWAFRARDVHGDHGIIAVALLDCAGRARHIDSFLMSCRVIGRTIETAILHFLEQRALARGAIEMTGEYLPTAKNTPCQDFFQRHQYRRLACDENGSRWSKALDTTLTECPEWITIETKQLACSPN